MLQKIPHLRIRNIFLYYLLTIVSKSVFVAGNWIFFWTKYMTYGQIGLIDAVTFFVGLILEIPAGGLADIIGKKKALMASMGITGIGIGVIGVSTTMSGIGLGFLIAQIGWALFSGTIEALAYDTLAERKIEKEYGQVIAASQIIGLGTTVISSLAGGLLFALHFRAAYLAWSFVYAIGLLLTFFLVEPKIDTEKYSLKGYFSLIKDGTKVLLRPNLRGISILIVTLLGVYYIYDWGLVKPAIATNFGFYNIGQSIIHAVLSVISAIALTQLKAVRKIVSDIKGLQILTFLMIVSFFLAGFKLGFLGVFVLILIGLIGTIAYPWISIVINEEVTSKYQATALSTSALISKLPYSLVAYSAGTMIDQGKLSLFTTLTSLVSLVFLLFSVTVMLKNRNSSISNV